MGLEAGSERAPPEGGSWGGWRSAWAQLSCVASIHPRSDASREELAELAQQANPEEIELGEDEDEDEMDLEPNGEGPAEWWGRWGRIPFWRAGE